VARAWLKRIAALLQRRPRPWDREAPSGVVIAGVLDSCVTDSPSAFLGSPFGVSTRSGGLGIAHLGFWPSPCAGLLVLGLLGDTARSSGCKQPDLLLLLQIAVLARDDMSSVFKHSSSCASRAVRGARHIAVRPWHSDHLSSNVTPGLSRGCARHRSKVVLGDANVGLRDLGLAQPVTTSVINGIGKH